MAELSYRAQQRVVRARRARLARQNLSDVRLGQLGGAPTSADRAGLTGAAFLVAALALHAGVGYAAMQNEPLEREPKRKIQVHVVTQPREEGVPAAVAQPTPAKSTQDAPRPPEPPKKRAPERPRPTPKPVRSSETKPPEVVAVPIVGLTLESTSHGSGGAAFAVGDTLLGTTAPTAAQPSERPARTTEAEPSRVRSRNGAARPRPAEGVTVAPARRLSRVEPTYPSLLQTRRIEGDVTVRVELDALGRVRHVALVHGAADSAFDEAALEAARRERFAPETHDGRPVPTSITYTYRFRMTP